MIAKRARSTSIGGHHDAASRQPRFRGTRYVTYAGKRWQLRGTDTQTGKRRITRLTSSGLEQLLVAEAELG